MTTSKKHFSTFVLWLFLIALAGSIALFMCTALWGIGANSDSAHYIGGARNILKGYGYRNYTSLAPITHWPPLFPFTLAAIGLLGIDPLEGARFLHVVLFGANILMVGVIVKKLTQSTAIALFGAWLMFTSKAMFAIHSWACSEPWFILLTFSGFYFLIQYLGGGPKRFLFWAGFLTALACVDRYGGIAVIAAGVMTIFLLHSKNFFIRIRDGILYCVLSSLLLGFWLLRNKLLAGDLGRKGMHLKFPSPKYFLDALDTYSSWILPTEFPVQIRYSIFAFVAIVVIALLIFVITKEVRNQRTFKIFTTDPSLRLLISMSIFMACYAGLHLVYHISYNASVNADDRHFSPIFVAGLLGLLVLLDRFVKLFANRLFFKRAAVVFFILVGFFYLQASLQTFGDFYRKGRLVTSRVWRTSPTLARIKALPADATIYSNETAAIYLLTNRPSRRIPRKYGRRFSREAASAQLLPSFHPQMEKVKEKLISRKGYVVFFDKRHQWYNVPKTELSQYFPIVVLEEFEDGTIYQIKPSKSPL